MQILKTIRRNFLSLTILHIIEKIASFLLIVIVARYLGKEIYGFYAFALAYSTFFMILSDFGINTYLTRDIAQKIENGPKYLNSSFSIRIVLCIISLSLLYLIIQFTNLSSSQKIVIFIVGFTTHVKGTSQLFIAFIRAHEQMQFEAKSGFWERFIAVSGGFIILYLGYGLFELVILFLFAAIIQFVYLLRVINNKFTSIHFDYDIIFIRKIIKEASPFLLANFMMVLNYRIDTILLSIFKNDGAVGIYNVAYNLIFSFMIIQNILGRTMFPVFAKYSFSDPDKFKQAYQLLIKVILTVVLPITIFITINAGPIINFLYGNEYYESTKCLQILIWSLIFTFSSYTMGSILLALKGEKHSFIGWSLCAGVNLLLNIIIIPRYGYIGASITTLLSEIIAFGIFYCFLVYRYSVFIIQNAIIIKLSILILILTVLFKILALFNSLIFVPAIMGIYLFVIYVIHIFTKEELQIFSNILSVKLV